MESTLIVMEPFHVESNLVIVSDDGKVVNEKINPIFLDVWFNDRNIHILEKNVVKSCHHC